MSGPPPIITLTTDFGLLDPYVAAMKGAILVINPAARLVDVSHAIRPQAIEQAVFVLAAAWPYFPPGAIHVVVVDPAVGSRRRALAALSHLMLQFPHIREVDLNPVRVFPGKPSLLALDARIRVDG